MKLTIYTDGASRGNPGLASYGFVILNEQGEVLYEEGKYIGINTNNFAEYSAVLEALLSVRENVNNLLIIGEYNNLLKNQVNLTAVELRFLADSKLVVEQLSGKYKIKSENLKPLIAVIKELEKNFLKVTYQHIPREKNKLADKLANEALDNIKKQAF